MPSSQKLTQTPASVHPLADRFPMMADHELADLAASIAENGLLQPIILDGDVLIDGRNRLAACKIAGVEPRFEQLNGHDPVGYILAANVDRRHLTIGQRAIAVAFAYPEVERTAPGKKAKVTTLLGSESVSAARLSQARKILRHSRDIAEAVLAGAMPFDEALAEVAASEQAALSKQTKLDRLRAGAPDLADLVIEHRKDIDEALAEMRARAEHEARTRQDREQADQVQRESMLNMIGQASRALETLATESCAERLGKWLADPNVQIEFMRGVEIVDPAVLERGFSRLRSLMEKERPHAKVSRDKAI